jgi:tRNA (guanine-N7-)-methyltransferase
VPAVNQLNPDDFIISKKRKLYKFALFHNSPLCFEVEQWSNDPCPQILEMGAGTGIFSVALVGATLQKQYVAVDVKADRLQTGAQLAYAKQMKNLRFLRARADQLPELLQPRSLSSIWVTFPDPFPKDRSAKHRLTHPQFLRIYENLLKKDGALYFKTDSKQLFDWSLEQLVGEKWHIRDLSFDLHESGLPDDYKIKTTYETRYINEGLKINFVKATPPLV